MQWRKRWAEGLLRPARWAWRVLRAGGGRLRAAWRLGTGPKAVLMRVAVLGAAAVLAWGVFVGAGALSGALTARRSAQEPILTGEAGAAAEPERVATDLGATGAGGAAVTTEQAEAANGREPVAAAQSLWPPAPEAGDQRAALLWSPLAWPVAGSVREPAGGRRRVESGYWSYERGVERAAAEPTVSAVLPGTVTRVTAAASPSSGHAVGIDHGDGLATEYKPLQVVYVTPGQYVSARAPIGQAASSVVFILYMDGTPLDV